MTTNHLITITDKRSLGTRMNWEYGEHSGTITFPDEGPTDIQWDGEAPDDWEDIEARVEDEASSFLPTFPDNVAKTPNTDRARLVDNYVTPPRPFLVAGVEVVPIYVSRKEEQTKNRVLLYLNYIEGRIWDAIRRLEESQQEGAIEDLKQLRQEINVRRQRPD